LPLPQRKDFQQRSKQNLLQPLLVPPMKATPFSSSSCEQCQQLAERTVDHRHTCTRRGAPRAFLCPFGPGCALA
jgi:hypothetical protein